jgi:hypothetical protein
MNCYWSVYGYVEQLADDEIHLSALAYTPTLATPTMPSLSHFPCLTMYFDYFYITKLVLYIYIYICSYILFFSTERVILSCPATYAAVHSTQIIDFSLLFSRKSHPVLSRYWTIVMVTTVYMLAQRRLSFPSFRLVHIFLIICSHAQLSSIYASSKEVSSSISVSCCLIRVHVYPSNYY